jgi:hypothetical protein
VVVDFPFNFGNTNYSVSVTPYGGGIISSSGYGEQGVISKSTSYFTATLQSNQTWTSSFSLDWIAIGITSA